MHNSKMRERRDWYFLPLLRDYLSLLPGHSSNDDILSSE